MIRKVYTKSGRKCRVTFKLMSSEVGSATSAHVLGDFNDWDREATPLGRRKKGGFRGELKLKAGRDYRFRYLLDGERWISDHEADRLEPNEFGDLDSVVEVPNRP